MKISIGLTQCGLTSGLRRDDFIIKLINLLIRELENFSSWGDFQVSRRAEICQFDRFPLEINSKEHVVVIMEFPEWVQVKMKILYIMYISVTCN